MGEWGCGGGGCVIADSCTLFSEMLFLQCTSMKNLSYILYIAFEEILENARLQIA